MPSLNIDIFDSIKESNIFKNYPIFIETGTFEGETIFKMSPLFKTLHTIEIKKLYYNNVLNKYNSLKLNNINFHLGDSSDVLIDLSKQIEQPSIFFLDGHWSSGNTGRGKKDCPLYEELNAIINNFKHNAIIIIDDARLFGLGPHNGTGNENWKDINLENILKIVKNRLLNNYFLPSNINNKDRLILHIK
tara:strand:- start:1114 stop:1683 length:570 start_codon:yes stop_codon:yes gene_type:complete